MQVLKNHGLGPGVEYNGGVKAKRIEVATLSTGISDLDF